MNIHEATYRRVFAFVRTIANDCSMCLHKNDDECRNCRSLWARSVLKDLEADRDEKQVILDYSHDARVQRIRQILTNAKRPLLAKEINLKDLCSPQLKFWTLNQMLDKGIIGRRFAYKKRIHNHKRAYFAYYLKNNKKTAT